MNRDKYATLLHFKLKQYLYLTNTTKCLIILVEKNNKLKFNYKDYDK